MGRYPQRADDEGLTVTNRAGGDGVGGGVHV